MKTFSDEIEKTIDAIKQQIQEENSKILDPNFHAARLSTALQDAVSEISTEVEKEEIVQQLLSIINQVPRFGAACVSEALTIISTRRTELSVWVNVRAQYDEYTSNKEAEDLAKAQRENQLLEDVATGKITERSLGDRPRDVGVHPGPSVRKLRAAKAKLKQSSS